MNKLLKSLLVMITFSMIIIGCTDWEDDDVRCPNYGPYFDIKGIETDWMSFNGLLTEGDTVPYTRIPTLNVRLNTEYVTDNLEAPSPVGGFFSAAYAQPCPVPEVTQGAKYEKLQNLTIITLEDFDSGHLANDTVNDLFKISFPAIQSYNYSPVPLASFLAQAPIVINYDRFDLYLQKAPVTSDRLRFIVIIELSTGEVDIDVTPNIFVKR